MGTITRNFANNILGTGEVDATDGVNGTIPATNVADASLNNVTSLPSSVGYAIKSVASDPPSLNVGEIFYNSTAGAFKALVNVEAWSSGAPMISAKKAAMPGGIQTAAFTAGGNDGPGNVNSTFEYNGSGFSTGGNINTTRRGGGGSGTLTAGLILGGFSTTFTNATEEYDGSSWTAGGNLGTARSGMGSNGLQTAAFAIGGYDGTSQTNLTEEYDGTSWTSGNTCPTSAGERGADGIQTAAIVFGGATTDSPGSQTSNSELYDGTRFTSASPLNTARERVSGFGTQSNAYAFGGDAPPTTTKTENYNGTSWTETSDMATARKENQSGQTGSPTAGIAMGGNTAPGSTISATEEFNSSTNTIVAAAWASGGNLNTARYGLGGAGTQTSGLAFGGSPTTGATEEYNGSTWTAGGSLGTSRYYVGGSGTLTAGLAVGGRTPPIGFAVTNTEEYDGSSWSAGGALPTANNGMHTSGIQTAGLAWGGISSPGAASNTATYEYDGSAWTSGGTLPAGVRYGMGAGTQTASLSGGGDTGGTTFTYDGSTWSDQAPSVMLTQSKSPLGFFAGAFGTQTSAIAAGGRNAPGEIKYTTSQGWDGSVWSTSSNLATARGYGMSGSVGTTTAGLVAGGQGDAPTYSNISATEEFTGETITQVAKTLSSS